jgi:hypothetical protein
MLRSNAAAIAQADPAWAAIGRWWERTWSARKLFTELPCLRADHIRSA